MKIKKALALSTFFLSSILFSASAEEKSPFDRVYIGGGVGHNYMGNLSSETSLYRNISSLNIFGKIGVSKVFNQSIYTAVEYEVGGLAPSTTKQDDFGAKVNLGLNHAAIFKLGYAVSNDSLIYGLAGYDYQSVNFKDYEGTSYRFNLNGFRIGAGFEKVIYQNETIGVSGNIEAFYKMYRSKTLHTGEDQWGDLKSGNINGFNIRGGVSIGFKI